MTYSLWLKSTESSKFILRAHIYQARSLFGSDDTGLSGTTLAKILSICTIFYLFYLASESSFRTLRSYVYRALHWYCLIIWRHFKTEMLCLSSSALVLSYNVTVVQDSYDSWIIRQILECWELCLLSNAPSFRCHHTSWIVLIRWQGVVDSLHSEWNGSSGFASKCLINVSLIIIGDHCIIKQLKSTSM